MSRIVLRIGVSNVFFEDQELCLLNFLDLMPYYEIKEDIISPCIAIKLEKTHVNIYTIREMEWYINIAKTNNYIHMKPFRGYNISPARERTLIINGYEIPLRAEIHGDFI